MASYQDIIGKLYEIAPSFQSVGRAAFHPGTDSMVRFMEHCGNPHERWDSIHVAGTNGKGSVSHLLASLLSCGRMRMKVGLYTSPHLIDFRERMRIVYLDEQGNARCEMISEEEVVRFWEENQDYILAQRPSFFEITTAMAFDWFARMDIDIAVVETGLGGRYDSTNVITPILSVITSIGLDHKNILGSSYREIAFEKGGIIKEGVPVAVGKVNNEALGVLRSIAIESDSPFADSSFESFIDPNEDMIVENMDLRSAVQRVNLRTVSASVMMLSELCGMDVIMEPEPLIHAAEITKLHGRWEKLSDYPEVICDIGHNEEALSYTMKQLEVAATGRKLHMILGMASDKDIKSAARYYPKDAFYYYTNAKGTRAMKSELLRKEVDSIRCEAGVSPEYSSSEYFNTVEEAVNRVMSIADSDDMVFIGGSSFVVAEALPLFLG